MPSSRRTWLSLILALLCQVCLAQPYPAKPVRLVVPAQPGGGLDLIGRTMGDLLGKALEQTFVVENIGGGGGAIACQTVARAAPDGYTLMIGYVATHATNPAVRKVPYDPVKDFTPIAMVGGTANMLVVHPSVPVSDLTSYIRYAKSQNGKLKFASGGIGTLNHLIFEQLKAQAGFDAVVAHYRGIGPAFQNLLSAHVETLTPGLAAALPHIRSGKAKAVAVTGNARHPLLPEVPTFAEAGFKGFDAVQWYGIVGPARMPQEVTRRLNAEVARALASPSLRQRFSAEAIEPMPMSPEQFGAYIQAELARYSVLARERKIQLDE
ncbi:MAG: Bug family tripartite tricarboxylate transporter substrate binding protein [Betaproteobacteria bacterium]